MNGGRPGRSPDPSWLGRRPLPQVARRLRVVFPELWTRYELLAATRLDPSLPRPRPILRRPEG